MNVPAEKLHAVRQWIEKAEHDLKNAEYTLTLDDAGCPFDTVCFHAQQCVEKYLKSVLVAQSVEVLKTHDLRLLMQRVTQIIPLGIEIGTVLVLNRYTIEARYPGDWEPITRIEAEEAVNIARTVREAVRAHLPTEVLEKQSCPPKSP